MEGCEHLLGCSTPFVNAHTAAGWEASSTAFQTPASPMRFAVTSAAAQRSSYVELEEGVEEAELNDGGNKDFTARAEGEI
ncbi:unnamed protein product [Linum trigynum]|uniref:Uncharacterized protein n=1 Tax=Linum trigynum TaxID=586398 RepID=A0AAV2E7J0_9ROSI